MIEKLTEKELCENGTNTFSKPLVQNLKINEIIDEVNTLIGIPPQNCTDASKAPKKRTAMEIVVSIMEEYKPNGSEFFDGVIDFANKIIKAFDREGIE